MDLKNHKGIIIVDAILIRNPSEYTHKIFNGLVIGSSKYNPFNDTFKYLCVSKRFDETKPDEKPPVYNVKIKTVCDNKGEIKDLNVDYERIL